MKITKDMLIADVVEKYPDIAIVFLEYGLHCVGCAASPFESIEMGVMGHGFSEKELNSLLKDLNNFVDSLENEKV